MKLRKGFTLIETAIVIAFVGLITTLIIIQKSSLDAFTRDETRKTAINTFYYSLTIDFYAKNGYYPEYINESNLPTVDPALWADPDGHLLGDIESDYHYTPADCWNGKCSEFTLSADLEKESAFTKTSPSLPQ